MRKEKLIGGKKEIKKFVNKKGPVQFSLSERIALKVVRTGTDRTNFEILEMLPSNIDTMIKELNLTKVPVNNRVNELEKVGLVERFRGTGNVVMTDFGKFFVDTIESYGEIVRKYTIDILNKHLE